jgi:hypothetical protein
MKEKKPPFNLETRLIEIITLLMKDVNWYFDNKTTEKGIRIGELIDAPEYSELMDKISETGKSTSEREGDLKELEDYFERWNREMSVFKDDGSKKLH